MASWPSGPRTGCAYSSTDLLTGSQSPTYVRSLVARNPAGASSALVFLPGSKLLAWRNHGGPPSLALLDVSALSAPGGSAAAFQQLPTGFKAPLLDLRIDGDGLLGIETAGLIQLTDLVTGASRFELRVRAHIPLWPVADRSCGGSQRGRGPGRIAPEGEHADRGDGVSSTRTPSRTASCWERWKPRAAAAVLGGDRRGGFNEPRPARGRLFRAGKPPAELSGGGPGREHRADPDTRVLYASWEGTAWWLGRQGDEIGRPGERGTAQAGGEGHAALLPEQGLNGDRERQRHGGKFSRTLNLFSDGEWCTLFRDGRYAASREATRTKVYADSAPVKSTEDYRLRIEGSRAGIRCPSRVSRGLDWTGPSS